MEALPRGDPASVIDPVTRTRTRAEFDRRLPAAVAAAERAGGRFAVVSFDVDYFKSVNDAYGHARGDDVLRHVAERVDACLTPDDELYRHGGDEFVLLLPHLDRAQGLDVATCVADAVAAAPLPGTALLSVSVSLGVAAYPQDGRTAEDLLRAADRRNYLAKRRGRGGAVADDVDTGSAVASSRLLQRDNALGAARRFIEQVGDGAAGVLAVHGEPGAGHTRFLAEVARFARLRGFDVLDADAGRPGPAGAGPPTPLLVVHDQGNRPGLRRLIDRVRTAAPDAPLGVVYAPAGGRPVGLDADLPVLGTVELQPWSPDVLRVWLRTVLRGEPGERLVHLVHRASRGLPAKARRELDRLTEQGALRRGDDGGWDVALAGTAPARTPYRVPTPMTELIGREDETAAVADLLARHRVVTLTGPGGVGKTRVSLAVATAVADDFPHGVAFVPLEEATDEVGVLAAIAQVLRVSEAPGRPLFETIAELLEDRCLLLVLDNFEQALAATPAVGQLLAFAPQVKALVTSRERLRLYGERVFAVGPLPLPDLRQLPDRADDIPRLIAASPALGLFEARAGAAVYRFAVTPENLPTVAELCHRLDGLPLAIELAAAHSDVLSPRDVLAGIVDRMDLLADGPPDLPGRQRSLRAAIDWSVALLSPADRVLFDELAVFTDGWSLAAAEAVCRSGGDTGTVWHRLSTLADKNLIIGGRRPDGPPRYAMLETIRRHAVDRLAARDDADEVRRRHASFYADFAERSSRELSGPGQAEWIGLVQQEYPNLRAAFSFALADGRPAMAARIAVGLWRYWRNGAYLHEGRAWLAGVLDRADLPRALRAQALHAAGLLAATQDDYRSAERLGAESLRLATGTGDAVTGAQAVNLLGFAAMGTGDYDTAHRHFTDSLQRWAAQDNPLGMATAYGNLTKVALRLGDTLTASERAAAAVALDRQVGNTRGIALGLECLGQIRLLQGDPAGARALLCESLSLSRSLGDVFGESVALHHLGVVAECEGDTGAAIGRITLALELQHEVGDQEGMAASLDRLAALVDDAALTADLAAAAAHVRERHGLPTPIGPAAAIQPVDGSGAAGHRYDAFPSIDHLIERLVVIAPDPRL